MNKKVIIYALISLLVLFLLPYFLLNFRTSTSFYPTFFEFSKYEEIQYENFDLNCVYPVKLEFVIKNEQNYQELLNYKSSSNRCIDFTLPQINFQEKTLLGKYAYASGCSREFIRRVYKDDANRQIIYVIGIKQRGGCEPLITTMNWVLVDKIPENYEVEFVVK